MAKRYDYTEEEIRKKLEELGYSNIPTDQLKQFQKDLKRLIEAEKAELLARGHPSLSTSDSSDRTDSYFEGSKDESKRSTDESLSESDKYRYPLADAAPRQRTPFQVTKAGHEIFGKENMQYYPSVGLSGRSESATTTESSPQEQSRPGSRNMRRKVLRKRDGASRVFDESFASTDSVTDISELEQRILELPLRDKEKDNMDIISVESHGSTEPSDYRPWENHADRALLPSFIRPSTRHPHTRQVKKTDPVSRYHQFKGAWQANKAPGEKSHKNLRWNVRGKMLQCDVFERPQRNYIPNNYVVPTDKKRQALRWEVRSHLARV
ncbi:hydrolethalus syndrome protein 1-like [Acropora millepora]|uniref:hydrolethalus syndrome protein 1-like n=1 Tax=Acropora millepora TaxID=45264 RepID=UPI001CF5E93D|nr:hydrolethalus syndrome protein 1-like [Acropora millepora]